MAERTEREAVAERLKPSALAFFGLFGLPLTSLESWRWHGAGRPVGFAAMRECLDGACRTHVGFYALPGASAADLAAGRWRRYRLAEDKFRKACRFAALARLLPTVRLVAVGNSLSWSASEENGDIDVFVVSAPGTVWVTRLVLGTALFAFGLRPTPDCQKDRICLSFLVSQDSLDLSGWRIGSDDVYLQYWLAALVPLYDAGGLAASLWAANWRLLAGLPHTFGPRRPARRRRLGRPFGYRFGQLLLPAFRALEPLARRIQERRFPPAIREMANRDTRVVVGRSVLKLHVIDRRAEFSAGFAEALRQMP